MRTRAVFAFALVLSSLALASPSSAVEGAGGPRGRVLLFPWVDSSAGSRTFLRVTWTGEESAVLHAIYAQPAWSWPAGGDVCQEFNRNRPITENDAEVWDVRSDAPAFARGFAIVEVPGAPPVPFTRDALFGDAVILSTAEGWMIGVSAIAWEPGAFVTFGNHFYPSFVTARLGAVPTRFVIVPFSILDDGTGGQALAQPRENVDGGTNAWTWAGNWYDHDENPRNMPIGRVRCWAIRGLSEIAPGATGAPAGHGWIDIVTEPGVRTYEPGGEMAVIFQVEAAAAGGMGWGFHPARRADRLDLSIAPGWPWPAHDGKTTIEIPWS